MQNAKLPLMILVSCNHSPSAICAKTILYFSCCNLKVIVSPSSYVLEITIQRRTVPLVVDPLFFNKKWEEYKTGFGEMGSDMWLGLEKLHEITTTGDIVWRLQVNNVFIDCVIQSKST